MLTNVLVIDDEPRAVGLLESLLTSESIVFERDAVLGMERLSSRRFDALFANLCIPSVNGLEMLQRAREIQPDLPVVAITAHGSVESAVGAFRSGAVDYLVKPFGAEQVAAALSRALSKRTEPEVPHREPAPVDAVPIVAASPAMMRLEKLARRAATASTPVLAVGEFGAGKERLVRRIHSLSPRQTEPFVKVCCQAVQEPLLREILFGIEPQTDSEKTPPRRGVIEHAAGGTLYLDNIASLPTWIQQQLLQAAQSGKYLRVGGSDPVACRARIAASTRKDPRTIVKKGELLHELYCFLSATPFHVPPLRERREDLRPLIEALIEEARCDASLSPRWSALSFTPEALHVLEDHDWPGNVCELSNFIRRIFVFADEPVVKADETKQMLQPLPTVNGADTITVPFTSDLKSIERAIVVEAIQRAQGNKTAAARSLGLHRKTLYRIIENGSQKHTEN